MTRSGRVECCRCVEQTHTDRPAVGEFRAACQCGDSDDHLFSNNSESCCSRTHKCISLISDIINDIIVGDVGSKQSQFVSERFPVDSLVVMDPIKTTQSVSVCLKTQKHKSKNTRSVRRTETEADWWWRRCSMGVRVVHHFFYDCTLWVL